MNEKEERAAWMVAPLPDLVRHLVGNCHAECRVDMALLETRIELAVLEEADRNPALLEVRDAVTEFCAGMRAHMASEERHLFPQLMARAEPVPEALASIKEALLADHESEASVLRGIRCLSQALSGEAGQDGRVTQVYRDLMELSRHLQNHLYLETHILFPRIP
jgi:regulator of cell morphogenesis and NO signaling